MEFGEKEKQVVLVALRQYLQQLSSTIQSDEADDDEKAELVNDATLVEIVIARVEDEA